MRLDQYLVQQFALSRSRAQLLIKNESVSVHGAIVKKPSAEISENLEKEYVTIIDSIKYVSRAGLKLECAVEEFGIIIKDTICLDIGSSTGGFTDYLIKHGASKVVAVDVGTDQFHASLKNDIRIELHEATDIRTFESEQTFDGIVCDVSFISLKNIIPVLPRFLNNHTWFVLLIKPQFEVGKEFLNKQGIVKSEEKIQEVIKEILDMLRDYKIHIKGVIDSPILGGDGNKEFLVYAVYETNSEILE